MDAAEEEVNVAALEFRLPPGGLPDIGGRTLDKVADDGGRLGAPELGDILHFLVGKQVETRGIAQEAVLVERGDSALETHGTGADPALQHTVRRDDIGLA